MTIHDLLARLDHVKRSGDYHTARCPGHEDKHNSLSVRVMPTGKLSVQCYAGCDLPDILGPLGLTASDLYPEDSAKPMAKTIDRTYDYTDEHGALIYQVVRYIPKSFRQRRPDPDAPGEWLWNLKSTSPVLYGLQRLHEDAFKHRKKVFIVEGEKDAEALWAIDCQSTTNAGGAAKWHKSFTETLANTTCIILPDNDDAGRERARKLHAELADSVILELPGLAPKGDVSDWLAAGGDKPALTELARRALAERDAAPVPAPAPQDPGNGLPFRVLGFDDDAYYFLSSITHRVVRRTRGDLRNKISFFDLAALNWWEQYCEGDFTVAAANLVERCHAVGPWHPEHVRGLGAWLDRDRLVLHVGTHLVVDGERVELGALETDYVYPARTDLHLCAEPPLDDNRARRIVEVCEHLRWEHPAAGQLLAGWIACASICGALPWRPHIWLTGPSGTGKSWISDHIVGALLEGMALKVLSVSTEAGIRQTLNHDARPVTFDEAEGDEHRNQANLQRVLELARQASSVSDGIIAKGTAGGQALTFVCRSMFCFSSIAVGLVRRADETRVTPLTLTPGDDPDHFAALQRLVDEVCTPETAAGLLARSCALAHIIRANAETFALAIAARLHSRRLGDQLGALVAGYWSLRCDREVSLDEAAAYVQEMALEALAPDVDESSDERRLLQRILEAQVRVEGDRTTHTRSLGELVQYATGGGDGVIGTRQAADALGRHGLRAEREGLYVSNTHQALGGILRGSPWPVNWGTILRRLAGAAVAPKPIRFAGTQSRALLLPPSVADADAMDPQPARNDDEISFP